MNLVRHFENEKVGAVAGVVKVGNPKSILTKWQALEYLSGISIERNAQALLGAIMIVPGACGAWRRSALLDVGGFSSSTLAEDCDLALKIQETGRYVILQDNEAIGFTEAPQSLMARTKQRFRWTFGNIQSLWKHHGMVFNRKYGWLGMYIMPSAIIAIAVPIVFWPLLVALTIENVATGNYYVVLLFFALSLLVQFLFSIAGIALAGERYLYLLAVPLARFTYGPIRMYILYKTVLTILKGVDVGWNKLARTGTAYDPLSAPLAVTAVRSRKT
jgi:biofilm PGA synthesis N-glycosyltransferase PgaC